MVKGCQDKHLTSFIEERQIMLNTLRVNMLLVGILLLIFGIGMIAISISVYIHIRKMLDNYDTKGMAKIKKVTKQVGHEALIPVYDLVHENILYELRSSMGAVEQKYSVGEEVSIWFKGENPYKFISEVELDIWNRFSLTFKTLGIYAMVPSGISILISLIIGVFIR